MRAARTDYWHYVVLTDHQAALVEKLVDSGRYQNASEVLTDLNDGPNTVGVKKRDEIGKDICTLHIARGQPRGRHVILFRVCAGADPPIIEVLRILHDAMDLAQHRPEGSSNAS